MYVQRRWSWGSSRKDCRVSKRESGEPGAEGLLVSLSCTRGGARGGATVEAGAGRGAAEECAGPELDGCHVFSSQGSG